MSYQRELLSYLANIIIFKDINLKEALLADSTINPDGTREITYDEAKSSSITGAILKAAINPNHSTTPNTDIVSFDEFEYFENVPSLDSNFLSGCSNLKSIKFPYGLLGQADRKNILKDTIIEELDVNTATLYGAVGQSGLDFGGNSLFGAISTLKVVWIDKVTSVVGRAFRKADHPNVEKVIISSVSQWLNITVNTTVSQKYDCLPTCSGKASLYIGSPTGQKVTEVYTTGVTALRDNLFYGVQGITAIHIEEPNTTVGVDCFRDLGDPETPFVMFGYNKIVSVGDGAFVNCHATGISGIPSGATILGNSYTDSTLQGTVSSTNLEEIGYSCFKGTNITSVILNKVDTINGNQDNANKGPFWGCSSLTSAELTLLPKLFNYSFFNCTALTQVKLDACTEFRTNAFSGCTSLVLLNAPNVKILGTECFRNCIGFSFTQTTGFTPPDLTETVEEIGQDCFYCLPQVGTTKVKVPLEFKKLAVIHDRAFIGCSPTTEGQDYVIFSKSDSIVTFVKHGTVAAQYDANNLFGGIKKIHVPQALLSDYQNDTEWAQMITNGITFIGY